MRQFGDRLRRLVTAGERADRVAGADDAVRRAGHDAGQQPRPPGDQHVPPGRLGDLPFEVDGPVADAPAVAERVAPAPAVIGSLGAGMSSSRRTYASTQPSTSSSRPRRTSTSTAIGPWLVSWSSPHSGPVPTEPLVRLVQNIVRHDRPPVDRIARSDRHGKRVRVKLRVASGASRRVRIGWHPWHDLTGGCPTNCDP